MRYAFSSARRPIQNSRSGRYVGNFQIGWSVGYIWNICMFFLIFILYLLQRHPLTIQNTQSYQTLLGNDTLHVELEVYRVRPVHIGRQAFVAAAILHLRRIDLQDEDFLIICLVLLNAEPLPATEANYFKLRIWLIELYIIREYNETKNNISRSFVHPWSLSQNMECVYLFYGVPRGIKLMYWRAFCYSWLTVVTWLYFLTSGKTTVSRRANLEVILLFSVCNHILK